MRRKFVCRSLRRNGLNKWAKDFLKGWNSSGCIGTEKDLMLNNIEIRDYIFMARNGEPRRAYRESIQRELNVDGIKLILFGLKDEKNNWVIGSLWSDEEIKEEIERIKNKQKE